MNDRELLEMAAKAAGLTTAHKWNAERLEIVPPVMAMVVHRNGELVSTGWNPLESAGVALRLAVKLNINITHSAFGVDATVTGSAISFEGWGADRLSATRRAIVRAAAAIGSAM